MSSGRPASHLAPSAQIKSKPRPVTVVVVSWNTCELLDRCLNSMRALHRAELIDAWVVDNGSSDGSVAMVSERHGWVRLVLPDENLGYGRAINLVAGSTRSPWLVISNADIALRPGALEALLRAAQDDPGAGVLAPRLLLRGGGTQHSVWPFPTVAAAAMQNLGSRLVPHGLAERVLLPGAWDPDEGRRVPWAIGAFLLIRREAWDAVGGFDPHQWMSAEDLDLGWRMQRAGWPTRYVPEALVDHAESAATDQMWGDRRAVHWQRCAYAWMVRRLGRRRTLAVGAVNLFGSTARFGRLLVSRRFRIDDSVIGLRRWTAVHLFAFLPLRTLDRYR